MRRDHAPKGLGLLETTIAIGIIITGCFAVFTLAIANARASASSAERLSALQFAREGIEAVRIVRDGNWLAGRPWDTGFAGDGSAIPVLSPTDAAWTFADGPNDFTSDATRIVRVATASGTLFVQDPAGGDGAGITPYRRLLAFAARCADDTLVAWSACDADVNPRIGARVTARVVWTIRGQEHALAVEEDLYDWR